MDNTEQAKCKAEIESWRDHRQDIPEIVRNLVASCSRTDCFDNVGPEPIPSKDSIIEIVRELQRILFPGYFILTRLDPINLEYYLGQQTASLFDALSEQIALCIRHECTRRNLPCSHCEESGRQEAAQFLKGLPELRVLLGKDVRAAFEGDPAAKSYDEIVFCYPGLLAVMVYRVAHQLHARGIPLMPRIMCEYVHGLTGIDIHPGARIGESFFIDHGVGVVIGETTEIGNGVRIYQGVTLGAMSLPKEEVERLRGKKRHPTIEDGVVIYAGATILGGETVIGANSVVGGNVWLTESVPSQTRVFIKKPELVLRSDAHE